MTLRDAGSSSKPFETFTQLDKAQRFLPFIEQFQASQSMMILASIKNAPDKLPVQERDQMIHYALNGLNQAIQKNSLSAPYHKSRAELLLLLPDTKPAGIIENLRRALVLDPYQLDTRLALAYQLEKSGAQAQAHHVLAGGFNKTYVADVEQARKFLSKIDSVISESADSAAQKQAIQQQLQALDSLKLASSNPLLVFTLSDIGWKP